MRNSDRWVTPAVVIVGILTLGVVLLGVAALVAYLTARHVDPDPMLRLVAEVATGASALGGFVLQLLNRKTNAKAELNSGMAARGAAYVADAVDAIHQAVVTPRQGPDDELGDVDPWAGARDTRGLPPVPPSEPRHAAAPAAGE